jgi:formyltetrahydrofolate-dependent phosphoribosylglycinamide formyltransferase
MSNPNTNRLRVAVLISGGGTTLLNFLKHREAGQLDIEIPIVIASRADCQGVERAKNAGLKCEAVNRREFDSVDSFSQTVFDLCREANAELVTLAGFLSLLKIPSDFKNRVMNIHPSLIPAFSGPGFYGHHVHEAVIARGAKFSGCTVHFADDEYDHGPIVLQRVIPVHDTDNADDVSERVFEAECEAFPEAIRMFASGRLTVEGQRTIMR